MYVVNVFGSGCTRNNAVTLLSEFLSVENSSCGTLCRQLFPKRTPERANGSIDLSTIEAPVHYCTDRKCACVKTPPTVAWMAPLTTSDCPRSPGTGYGLDNRGSISDRGKGYFPLLHGMQTGPGGPICGDIAAGTPGCIHIPPHALWHNA